MSRAHEVRRLATRSEVKLLIETLKNILKTSKEDE